MSLLKNDPHPEETLSEMLSKGDLIFLKEDFFGIKHNIEISEDSYEHIANHLYEPSYVSFEWALAYYRMIPEAVFVVTNISTQPSTHFATPMGYFYYTQLSQERFDIGIYYEQGATGKFLIATPEKTLADCVFFTCGGFSADEILFDLVESRRIDEDALKRLNRTHMHEIADKYQSEAVTNL